MNGSTFLQFKWYSLSNYLWRVLLLEVDVHLVGELGQLGEVHLVQAVPAVVERGDVKVYLDQLPTEPLIYVIDHAILPQLFSEIEFLFVPI